MLRYYSTVYKTAIFTYLSKNHKNDKDNLSIISIDSINGIQYTDSNVTSTSSQTEHGKVEYKIQYKLYPESVKFDFYSML